MNESTLVPREEMSDLDWLARNVHVWPAGEHQPWCYVYMTYGGVMKAAGNFLDAAANPTMITIEQWLARRAELQNKPSWDACPEWAQWLAQDADGCWHWFKGNIKPEIQSDNKTWSNKYASFHKVDYGKTGGVFAGKGSVLGFCNDTLEKRPADLSEQAVTVRLKNATDNVLAAVPELMTDKYKFTPFISIEDNQEKDMTKQQEMKQDNGWFERGELPLVGLMCEIRHSCWNSEKYDKVTIVAITNEYLIVKYETLEQHYMLKDISFRPIRTERDELVNVFINHYGNPKGAEGYIGIADAILAEGFSLEAK